MQDEWFEANRALWNERVPIHARSQFYGVAELEAGARVYRMPAGRPSLPMMYSLRARKPAE